MITTTQSPCGGVGTGDDRVRVLIADPDGLLRRMMHTALQRAEGIVALPAAGDARETLELVRYYRPTVLIIATTLLLDGCRGLIGELLRASPGTRVITASAEEEDETALAALRAGAVGHIGKDINPRDLPRLVGLVGDGEAIVPRRMIAPLLGRLREIPDAGWRPLRSRLTTREWEIVELLADDASTEVIAERLVVSPTTVYSHVKSVLHKLGVHSRQDAVIAAERLRREEAIGRNHRTSWQQVR